MNRKLIFLLGATLSLAAGAAEHPSCKSAEAPKMELTYPSDVMAAVLSGKQSTTVRNGIRCFHAGDVLKLVDQKDKAKTDDDAVVGEVKVEKVEYVSYDKLPESLAKGQGLTVPQLQNLLTTVYSDKLKKAELTGLSFKLVPAKK